MTAVRRLLIDGKLVESERTYPTLNPATGEVLGHAPDATAADAEAAVAAARRALDSTIWPNDRALRIRCLKQLYQALTGRTSRFPRGRGCGCGRPAPSRGQRGTVPGPAASSASPWPRRKPAGLR